VVKLINDSFWMISESEQQQQQQKSIVEIIKKKKKVNPLNKPPFILDINS